MSTLCSLPGSISPARSAPAGYGLDVERIVRLFDGEVPAALRGLIEGEVAQSRVHRAAQRPRDAPSRRQPVRAAG